VVFIEVNIQVVDKLNADRCYPIKFISNRGNYGILIENVRAVNGLDMDLVAQKINLKI